MRPRPLALTDNQLNLVRRAASGLMPTARVKFLEAIADQLMGEAETTDQTVALAIAVVLARLDLNDDAA